MKFQIRNYFAFIGYTHAVLCFRRNVTKQNKTAEVRRQNRKWLLVKKKTSMNFQLILKDIKSLHL